MSEDQKKLQALSDAYQKLQTDLQGVVAARQKLESQQQENLGVQKVSCSSCKRWQSVADRSWWNHRNLNLSLQSQIFTNLLGPCYSSKSAWRPFKQWRRGWNSSVARSKGLKNRLKRCKKREKRRRWRYDTLARGSELSGRRILMSAKSIGFPVAESDASSPAGLKKVWSCRRRTCLRCLVYGADGRDEGGLSDMHKKRLPFALGT